MSKTIYNPDCGYAWFIVAACFAINFIMAGLLRAAGVLYVALIDAYGVSRETATMPFSIRFCVRNLSGPLVGALGQRFGIRPIVLLGGVMCGLGGILSALAPNVTWIIVAWGGIHGLGYGLCGIIHVIMINHYFDKYKGIALGINYTGDCFGTFFLPLLLDFLLEIYDLKGTFLILAGISLNVIPAAMLLRSPPWETKNSTNSDLHDKKCLDLNNRVNKGGIRNEGFDATVPEIPTNCEVKYPFPALPIITINTMKNVQSFEENYHNLLPRRKMEQQNAFLQRTNLYLNQNHGNHRLSDAGALNEIHSLRESSSLRELKKDARKIRGSFYANPYSTNRKSSQTSVLSCPSCIGKFFVESLSKKQLLHPSSAHLPSSTQNQNYCDHHCRSISVLMNEMCDFENPSNLDNLQEQEDTTSKPVHFNEVDEESALDKVIENLDVKQKYADPYAQDAHKQNVFVQFLRTNLKPMFLIISLTMALYVFLFISVFTIIIDYAADNNIPIAHGRYLIICFSVTDIFGRVGLGIVLDRKWIRLCHFAGLTTGLMGFCILIIPLFKCFIFWIISFSVCGFIQGGTCIMFPLLVDHYMEKNEESVALGSLNFYGGLLMLPVPPLIGFFRDTIGSYDGVFWTVGALCMIAGSLWIFEPCITRNKIKMECQKNYIYEEEKF